ncbi:hypothetical protein [Deinococcus navajonensis]|uniref:Uncharacterized protein n=1 Tax=Deinococcus navajonensis TaxID=309884 RepID=A0ABV8XIP0_9DEIO
MLWARVEARSGGVEAGSVWINAWDFQAFQTHFEPLSPDERLEVVEVDINR